MTLDHKSAGLPRRRKIIYSIAFAACVLLIMELALRALGLFAPELPFTSFKSDRGQDLVRYNWNELTPEFEPRKPAGAFRIMVFGGSTALGFPFQPRSSFATRLQTLLERAFPGKRIEMIVLAKVGMNSTEIRELMPRALCFQPDLVIVYTGQNEFISISSGTLAALFGPGALHGLNPARLRIVKALDAAARLAAGAAMIAVAKRSDQSSDAPIELPAPEPIAAEVFKQTLASFDNNLRDMISMCKAANVPVIMCATASNLADWPPDLRPLPPGNTAGQREKAIRAIERAKELADKGQYRAALGVVDAVQKDMPDYPPLAFERGRIELAMVPGGADPAKARADFQRALDLTAAISASHRAPSALNRVIRERALDVHAWLLPTDELFERVSPAAPGFDWFEDHCHPTLKGQQMIAEALLELMKSHALPAPASEWRPPMAWSEKAFRSGEGIDDTFLHGVKLRMGIYLGLEKDLPDHSAATRDALGRAAELDPDDPLPIILSALVSLYYGDTMRARDALLPWWPIREKTMIKCLDRYLTTAVDLRDGVFMAKLEREPGAPPLRGLMKSGLFENAGGKLERPKEPIESYNVRIDLKGERSSE